MTKDQLVAKLQEMRKAGTADRRGRAIAMGHLFGIIFDSEIAASGANAAQIALEAGVPGDGGIRDGQNLAGYVNVKPAIEKRWRGVTRSGEELPITQEDLTAEDLRALAEAGLESDDTLGEREASVALLTAAEDLLKAFLKLPPPRAGPDPVAAAVERAAAALEEARADVARSHLQPAISPDEPA